MNDKNLNQVRAISISFIVPMYCDWESVSELLRRLADADRWLISGNYIKFTIVIVDDSPQFASHQKMSYPNSLAGRIKVLKLRRNVGHQRAIAIGLAFVIKNMNDDYVVIMDGDGEDSPSDVPRLLEAAVAGAGNDIIFAERTKRNEAIWFRTGYAAYKLLHWVLTGHRIRFGNFSVIPHDMAGMVLASPDLWSHYAAAVVRLRLPYQLIPTERAARYAGQSKMSPISLIAHGLTAVSVFYEVATVRITLLMSILVACAAMLLSTAEVLRLNGPAHLVCRTSGLWILAATLVFLSLHQSLAILRSKTHSEVMPSIDAPLLIEVEPR